MNTRPYIPNERRILVAIRYDNEKMPEADLISALEAGLQEIDGEFVKPTGIEVGDGAFDWSFTTLDKLDPVATIRIIGEVVQADSVMPVEIIDEDTLLAETWLDSEIVKEEQLLPEGEPNRLRLADGHLVERIKELMNHERNLSAPRALPERRNTVDDMRWHLADAGDVVPEKCEIPGCGWTAWVKNPTAKPTWICEGHYTDRAELYRTGQVTANNPEENWLEAVGGDWPTAMRLEMYMARPCLLCGSMYGEHYGARCPIGGQRFRCQEDFIGYDMDGALLYRGDEQQLCYTRTAEKIIVRAEYIAILEKETAEYNRIMGLDEGERDAGWIDGHTEVPAYPTITINLDANRLYTLDFDGTARRARTT